MKGRRKLIVVALAVLVAAGVTVYALVWWETRQPKNILRLQGHMEATQTDLSFKVSGLIEYIFFQEGDWVKSGQKTAGLEAKDLKDEVDRALACLAVEDRELLILREVEGLTNEECASLLGLGLSALKSRLHRARLRFVAYLRGERHGH